MQGQLVELTGKVQPWGDEFTQKLAASYSLSRASTRPSRWAVISRSAQGPLSMYTGMRPLSLAASSALAVWLLASSAASAAFLS